MDFDTFKDLLMIAGLVYYYIKVRQLNSDQEQLAQAMYKLMTEAQEKAEPQQTKVVGFKQYPGNAPDADYDALDDDDFEEDI